MLFLPALLVVGPPTVIGCSREDAGDVTEAPGATVAQWRLDSVPTFQVGDDPADSLYFTRITAVRLLGKRVVVANGNHPAAIFVLHQDGEHLRTLGRDGEGPGEFRYPAGLWVAEPDTVIVFDLPLSRVTYFLADGAVLRTVRFDQPPPRVLDTREFRGVSASAGLLLVERFADDTYLTRPNRAPIDPTGERGRSHLVAERLRADGSVVDTLGVFPDADYIRRSDGQHMVPLFGRRAAYLAEGDHAWTGIGDEFVVELYDLDGRLVRRFERPFTRRPVTADLLDAYRAARLASVTDSASHARLREQIDTAPVADTAPALDGSLGFGREIVRAPDGTLWVRGYRAFRDSAAVWSVFDPAGRLTAELRTPPQFALHDMGADFVVGVRRHELDVETVVRFELRRDRYARPRVR